MPYRFETHHIRLPREKDRRVKLTDAEREDIRERHKAGESIRSIARFYEDKVTRRVIQYTVRPDLYDRMRVAFVVRRKDGRYKTGKTEHAEVTREHRQYKQRILTTNN